MLDAKGDVVGRIGQSLEGVRRGEARSGVGRHEGSLLDHRDLVQRRVGKDARGLDRRGCPVDRGGVADLCDAATIECRGATTQQERFRGLGGGIDQDRAALAEDAGQFLAQLLTELVVEIGERLVEQHEVGALDQRARDRGALLLAAGELGGQPVEHRLEAQHAGGLCDAPLDFLASNARDPQGRCDVLAHGQRRVIDELLVDHGDRALAHGHAGDVAAFQRDPAGGRPLEAGHEAHQRRLACEGRAQQDVHGAALERHRDVGDDVVGADPQSEMLENQAHAARSAGATSRMASSIAAICAASSRMPSLLRRQTASSARRTHS